MLLFPAIDLYQGQVVRLRRGDYAQMTVYGCDPPAVARGFREAGARWLHVVDLQGAKSGATDNFAAVRALVEEGGLHTEVGGGIRTEDTVRRYLELGASRVILGTAAVEQPDFLRRTVEKYGEKIAVGVDIRAGQVAIKGWTESSGCGYLDFIAELEQAGVSTIICTDIARDGLLQGTNVELYRELGRRFTLRTIASGGVSSLGDIRELRESGVYGAILGQALYTGAIDLRQAIELAGSQEKPA